MGLVIQSAVEVVVAGTEEIVVALAVGMACVRTQPLLPTAQNVSHLTPSESPSNSLKMKSPSARAGAIQTEYPSLNPSPNPKQNPKPNMAHKPPSLASSGICSCALLHHAETAASAGLSPRTPCLRNRHPKCAHKPNQHTQPPPLFPHHTNTDTNPIPSGTPIPFPFFPAL